jgi:hypothetical protein
MTENEQQGSVKVRAKSPGKHTVLVVETPSGELRTVYRETGYDLERGKPVDEAWLRENAVGRHSFIAVDPPEEVTVAALKDYARDDAGAT